MEEDLKEVGRKTNYTVEVFTPGPMVEAMTENILKIRSMDSVFMSGQTVRNTRVIGSKESNMDRESLLILRVNQE